MCVCASPVCMHTQCCVVLKVWLIYNIEKKCCLLSCRDTGTALPIAKEMNILIQMLLPLCPVHMMCNVCVCVHVCCLRHCNKYETLINWMSQRHIMYTYYMRINNTTAYTMHNLYVHMHACYAFAITKNIHMGKTMLNVFSWRTKNKKKTNMNKWTKTFALRIRIHSWCVCKTLRQSMCVRTKAAEIERIMEATNKKKNKTYVRNVPAVLIHVLLLLTFFRSF